MGRSIDCSCHCDDDGLTYDDRDLYVGKHLERYSRLRNIWRLCRAFWRVCWIIRSVFCLDQVLTWAWSSHSARTYLYLCCSEKCFEHCRQRSERAGLLLEPFARALLLPLDVESRGDADKVGVTSPIGSGDESFIVEDSGKAKGSIGREPGMAEGKCSDSEGAILLLLDVGSRGDARKVAGTPPMGSGE